MKLNDLFYTRHLVLLRPDIKNAIDAAVTSGEPPKLTPEQDRVWTTACELAPGFPEAFATAATRDRRLGPFCKTAEFLPAYWAEAERAEFEVHDIAIGHGHDELGFHLVSAIVFPALAARIQATGDGVDLVVNRHRYSIAPDGTVRSAYGVFGNGPSDDEFIAICTLVSTALKRLLGAQRVLTEATS